MFRRLSSRRASRHPTEQQPDAKVAIELRLEDGSVQHETVWADALGGDRYRIWNMSAYVGGINLADVVRCSEGPGFPLVEEVVEQSGNLTLWITLNEATRTQDQQAVLDELHNLGAGPLERFSGPRWGVNVPPKVNYQALIEYLRGREKADVLREFVEAWRLPETQTDSPT